jgi:hypothetical protein
MDWSLYLNNILIYLFLFYRMNKSLFEKIDKLRLNLCIHSFYACFCLHLG